MRWALVATVVGAAAVACRSSVGSERLGDEAYANARYLDAFAAYKTAVSIDPAGRLWAKVGAAALRTDSLEAAADAYLRLAGEDPTRVDEAAEGLEIVARDANRKGKLPALQASVAGLEAVGPERLGGQLVLAVTRRPGTEPADVIGLLPGAIAAAADPRTVDSLLGVYGAALQETKGCESALPVYYAVRRRSHEPPLLDEVNAAIVQCTETVDTDSLASDSLTAPDSMLVDSMGVP